MGSFNLYRSGIHDATFEFNVDNIIYYKRDVVSDKWELRLEFTEQDGLEYEAYYHINPFIMSKRMNEYKTTFQTNEKIAETSWGAIYYKDEENHHLWVERCKKYPLDVVIVDGEPVAFISPSRENCSVFVKKGYEQYTPIQLWQEGNVSPAAYKVKHEGSYMVQMRDGIKLATDVWLPNGKEKSYPTIFIRTPYGRMLFEKSYTNFVERGYGIVIQDTRGRQDSEGEWIPMYNEVEDGDDSLNWIADQLWCDGNIGMIGASYGGFVQWAAAASGNPHLKAMISIVTAGSPFIDIPRKGGTLISGMLAWTFAMVEKEFKPENMSRDDWDDVLNTRPIKDIPKKVLGIDVPFWNKWMQHETDDHFWKASSWSRDLDKIKAPAMIVSGWFDDNGMGTTEALEAVKDYKPEDKKVLLGPWMHSGNSIRDIQGVPLGNNALKYDIDYYFQQWFDFKLKGIENNINDKPTVEYYDVGVSEWKQATTWPPENITWTKIYLSQTQYQSDENDNGTLHFNEAIKSGQATFEYDPANPAPHLIDMSENEIGVPADYQHVEKRDDVLVYSTPPLEEPVTMVGDIRAVFFAASSAKDTDWVVRITDVDPEGTSTKLVEGILRARFRNGYEKEELLEPDAIEKYEIRTSKLANTFKQGHRIRLSITSSASNFVFPNTNTGADPVADVDMIKATQTVYYSDDYPSHLEVPLLEHKEE